MFVGKNVIKNDKGFKVDVSPEYVEKLCCAGDGQCQSWQEMLGILGVQNMSHRTSYFIPCGRVSKDLTSRRLTETLVEDWVVMKRTVRNLVGTNYFGLQHEADTSTDRLKRKSMLTGLVLLKVNSMVLKAKTERHIFNSCM